MACFDLATEYSNEKGAIPGQTTGMMTEIEETVQMLIEMGETNNVEMNRVLNQIGKDGLTLFSLASMYSEKVASQLLDRRVNVNIVDCHFFTPDFQVSK